MTTSHHSSSSEVVEVHILVAALSEEASVAVASEVEAQVVAGRIINNKNIFILL